MATSVVFNGITYTVPAIGDASWGTNVSSYLIAIASGALQKTGGAFTLTAELSFGATYGVKTPYLKSNTASIAAAGFLMLAKTDTISWRNNANSADLALAVNASDQLTFAGSVLAVGTGDVAGPGGSIANEVALFNGTTGKIIKGGGGGTLSQAIISLAATAGADADTILTISSNRVQTIVPTAQRTYTLPTTSIKAGDRFTLANNAAVSSSNLFILINSSGANLVRTLYPKTSVDIIALQDTPTTAAHWMCVGEAVSEWTAFTPTLTNSVGAKTGYWRRQGDSLQIQVKCEVTGGGGGVYTSTLPMSLSINTSKIVSTASNNGAVLGTAEGFYAGTSYRVAQISYSSSTTVQVLDTLAGDYWSTTVPGVWANGDNFSFAYSVPISGWTSSNG